MAQSILVVGGTGMLGEPVARRLCADGHHVRIFTRSPEKAQARFGAEYEVVAGDVENLPVAGRRAAGLPGRPHQSRWWPGPRPGTARRRRTSCATAAKGRHPADHLSFGDFSHARELLVRRDQGKV